MQAEVPGLVRRKKFQFWKKEIGKNPPEILEILIENYDKSIPEHRMAIKQYFAE